ncbi:aminoimidazole riboside kinase (plasmid) [Plesiomonas shigelloides]|uniref:aminoimidazole riboside kinase n=1 Tax=Plesiomonas shigelloides TaxID=703 RepID=UPI000D13BFAD|nr:aminoimidazole riboside kinase [Plesiomonas shigelloides]AVQ88852.1 aminoimidazole riboside kinase [Plesiomonas shigelloides]MCX2499103.1 aminoimidazole riboside kinase [Plesiomonas shigelloides]
MNIWALGDAVIDLLPLSDMQYKACAGGAPLNVAVGTARLCCQSGFIGRVGNDDFGYFLKKTLSDAGVSTANLQFDSSHRTSTVLVSLNNSGEREFKFLTNPSADQYLTSDDLPEFNNDILHFCSLALVSNACRNTLITAIQKVKQCGGLLSFDINLREQMWLDKQEMLDTVRYFSAQADILKFSEEELYWITGSNDLSDALEALRTYSAQLKVVTCGKHGARVLWHNTVIHFNGYTVDSVDTTGAGDAFVAGMLAWVSHNGMPENFEQLYQAITQACACGALATTRKGALTALPDTQKLKAFITQFSLPDYSVEKV